jgi:hypothetical protein
MSEMLEAALQTTNKATPRQCREAMFCLFFCRSVLVWVRYDARTCVATFVSGSPCPKWLKTNFQSWLGGSSFSSSQSSCRVKGTFTIRLEVQAWPMWHVLRDFHGFPLAHGTCQEVSMLGTITRSLVGWFSDESGQSIQ